MGWCFYEWISRKKPAGTVGELEDARLGKVYNMWDMVVYGVGSTLGAGVYVLCGAVSKTRAGPAAILSFLIAASGSAISGLCYAEFGGRVPRSGSAYNFSYVCVGEIIAFIIGWDLIMEYSIGVAALARAFGTYIDNVADHEMSNAFKKVYNVESRYFESYFDFFAFGMVFVTGAGLAFGLKQVKWVMMVLVCINLLVIIFSIVAGSCFASFANWNLPGGKDRGSGGFFPFGFEGVISGAAEAFFGFVGFDGIACAGEEVRDPAKSIPRSIWITLLICFLVYCGMCVVTTLALPYYEQDPVAAMVHIFEVHGFIIGKWTVFVGGLSALTTSLFGCLFPLPRMIYAMSKDKMLFGWCGIVHSKFKTPIVATFVGTLLTSILAATIKMDELVNMMSIGTLMAYTLVATGIMLIRYDADDPEKNPGPEKVTVGEVWRRMWKKVDEQPTVLTSRIAKGGTTAYVLLATLVALTVRFTQNDMFNGRNLHVLAVVIVMFTLMLLTLTVVQLQPKSTIELPYKVPLVPWLPALAVFMNLYLMATMDTMTWIRFGAWCIVGLIIYTSYSYWHSKRRKNRLGQLVNEDT